MIVLIKMNALIYKLNKVQTLFCKCSIYQSATLCLQAAVFKCIIISYIFCTGYWKRHRQNSLVYECML